MGRYRFSQVSMEGILQSANFKEKKNHLDNDSDWHTILDWKVKHSMYLTGSVKVEEYKGVVVVEIDKLLKKEGGCDLWLYDYF